MGLYNFKKRFVPFILQGLKTHTIRAERKYPDKPGNTMHLYTALRTKYVRLLMRRPCIKVEGIIILPSDEVWVDDNLLDSIERDGLARRDGFSNFTDFAAFWQGRLPFFGGIYHWEPPLILTSEDYIRAYSEAPRTYRSIARIEPDGSIVPRRKGLNSLDYDNLKARAIEIAKQRLMQMELLK